MSTRPTAKDLFGKATPQKRPRYEAALERAEKRTLPVRAARIRWLSKVIPKNYGFVMPLETACVFEEAKASFIYGNFAAAIVLAAAFVEHWFIASLASSGYKKEASKGLAACIKFARDNKLVDALVLDKADQLRLIRNPFVHLKLFDHKHNVAQRAWKFKTDPWAMLEDDAKDALVAMYGVARYAFSRHLITRP
jgi:hypothetical protein